jgi:hypothetical protein
MENYTKSQNSVEQQQSQIRDFSLFIQTIKNNPEFSGLAALNTENPRVGGSIPSLATMNSRKILAIFTDAGIFYARISPAPAHVRRTGFRCATEPLPLTLPQGSAP